MISVLAAGIALMHANTVPGFRLTIGRRSGATCRPAVKMIAVVAPAVAAAFPHRYLNLNGWLKESGVSAVFDVSFGAELTVQSYLRHIKENDPPTVVAQPCAAIVSYIELYRPDLLQYLAPAGSPMHHVMRMVRNEFPQYSGHKIVVISPCIAKRREYDETGLGDYNVTMQSLDEHFKSRGIDLSRYPATEFDGPPAERAVLFSSPGGLRDTLERWSRDAARSTRKIEGCPGVYHYLDDLSESVQRRNCSSSGGLPQLRKRLQRRHRHAWPQVEYRPHREFHHVSVRRRRETDS